MTPNGSDREAGVEIVDASPDDPRVLALLAHYFEELRARVSGYEPPSLADLRADGARGATLLLLDGGVGAGCGSVRLLDDATAEVKRMFVVADARGRGHARRILAALEARARALGCGRVVLDTAGPLHEAAALYLRAGYAAIAPYNANPVAARWFEKSLAR